MFTVEHRSHNSWSVLWRCDHCGDTTWPLLRIVGYPGPDEQELVDAGQAVLKGCLILSDQDLAEYECPQCEMGVDVPVQYRDE